MASGAPFLVPDFRRGKIGPTKGKLAWSVRDIVVEPFLGLVQGRDVSGIDPPHANRGSRWCLEEIVFARIDVAMNRLEYKFAQRVGTFPYRHIDVHRWVVRPMQAHGADASGILQPPDKTGHAFGQRVDARQIGEEVLHARIVWSAEHAPNVNLRQMHG